MKILRKRLKLSKLRDNKLKKIPKSKLKLRTSKAVFGLDLLSRSRLRFLKTQSSPLVRPCARQTTEGHETLVLSL